MIIEIYRKDDEIMNRPANKKDKALFKHCSGGYDAVKTRYLSAVVIPLLQIHGVSVIEYEDNRGKVNKE